MRTKAIAVTLAGLLGLAANADWAEANPMATYNPAAISGTGLVMIDFESLAGANKSADIGNYYELLGLTISTGLHILEGSDLPGGVLPAGWDDVAASNGGVSPAPDITFSFATGRSFGFDLFTLGASDTTFVITAYSGGIGTVIDTVVFDTGAEPKFIGVVETDSTKWFDTIVVSSQSEQNSAAAFAIDNIRMKVPEPGSLSLLAFGVVTLIGGASRTRRRQA